MKSSKDIIEFWNSQAKQYKESLLATIPDAFVKSLEIKNIMKFLSPGDYVADLGCGNGYSSFEYIKKMDIKIEGLDASIEMINVAQQKRDSLDDDLQRKISFVVGDIMKTPYNNLTFDKVISDRCLINLTSRDDQHVAIKEIYRILKPNGLFLMCEDTEQGLSSLNKARMSVGLDPIKVRWHNLYIDERHLLKTISGYFKLVNVYRFSSFYYLASRVINAKLAQMNNEEPDYNSDINCIAHLISDTIDCGDYGPLKLFVLKKLD
jgi:ubiquinone/menaquinone biosynthesis C-methylase UbiE